MPTGSLSMKDEIHTCKTLISRLHVLCSELTTQTAPGKKVLLRLSTSF